MARRHDKVARRADSIKALLELPKNEDIHSSYLVFACTVRDVDMHGKRIADLSQRIQRVQDEVKPKCHQISDISVRLHELARDTNKLRQLVEDNESTASDARGRQDDHLNELRETIKQHSTGMAENKNQLEAVTKMLETLQEANSKVDESCRNLGQAVEVMQQDIKEHRIDPTKVDPRIGGLVQDIATLKERMEHHSDNEMKTLDDVKLIMRGIDRAQNIDKKLALTCPNDALKPSANLNLPSNNRGKYDPGQHVLTIVISICLYN